MNIASRTSGLMRRHPRLSVGAALCAALVVIAVAAGGGGKSAEKVPGRSNPLGSGTERAEASGTPGALGDPSGTIGCGSVCDATSTTIAGGNLPAVTGSTVTTTHGGTPGTTTSGGASVSQGAVKPGGTVRFQASGFRPGSQVRVELHSDPILLRTLVASPTGDVSGDLTIPTTAPEGNHHVVASGLDASGAAVERSVPLIVGGDVTPPKLVEFSFSPGSVDTSATAKTIHVRARITDDGAGNAGDGYNSSPSQVRFVSPSGSQSVTAMLAGYQRTSGTAQDGIYEYDLVVPALAEQGIWTAQNFLLVDQVGNHTSLTTTALTTAGFPTTFEVVRTG